MKSKKFPTRKKFSVGKKKGLASKKYVVKKFKEITSKEELKHVDTFLNSAITTTATFTLLNGMAQGDTTVLRHGNEVSATSIQFRGAIVTDADCLTVTRLRCLVVVDRQTNGAAPTSINDILDVGIITDPILAPYAHDTYKRYKIKYDKTFTINPVSFISATVAVPYGVPFKKRIKLSRTIKYGGTGATVASINSNSIYHIWVSDQAGATAPTVEMGTRFHFKDD